MTASNSDGNFLLKIKEQKDNKGFERLHTLCTKFGPRLNGSSALKEATEWCYSLLCEDFQKENVTKQTCQIPSWKRLKEHAALFRSKKHFEEHSSNNFYGHPDSKHHEAHHHHHHHHHHNYNLGPPEDCLLNVEDREIFRKFSILSIGSSISTSLTGLNAQIVIVNSFDHLNAKGEKGELKGKIVLFNFEYISYAHNSCYRFKGGLESEKYGALAAVIRSVGPVGHATPHTGTMDSACKIPVVACSAEDAFLAQALVDQGEELFMHLCIQTHSNGLVPGHNLFADLKGSDPDKSKQVIVIGGHLDSWDVGQGANDDAQGCLVAWEALRLLKSIGATTKRTLRCVLFVDEEQTGSGAKAYSESHQDISNVYAAIESDLGCWRAVGFGISSNPAVYSLIRPLMDLLKQNGFCEGELDNEHSPFGRGVDIGPLIDRGVPGLLLKLAPEWSKLDYWKLHHTEADTVDKINPADFSQNVALCASLLFLLGNLEADLPHHKPGEF